VCLGHQVDRSFFVFILEKHQAKGELAFSCENILRPKFNLKSNEDVFEMFISFFVVDAIDSGIVIVFDLT